MAFALSNNTEQLKLKDNDGDKAQAYERQMETYTMRNAVENDYFQTLTLEDVIGHNRTCVDNEGTTEREESDSKKSNSEKDCLKNVVMAKFNSSRLRNVGIVNRCLNLTICDLSCNFLRKIDSLIYCQSLVKLDVHQNQITELPNEDFWYSLKDLSVVYLHNNGISTFDELQKLRVSQSLTILTLHDTPVSIKPHYRHFVVNSIWSLKALDNTIISDEELIEDAKFENQFKVMQPHFCFKPTSLIKKDEVTLNDEKNAIRSDISLVNRIQARFCPVLIIQRCIRGYLTRMRFQYIQDTRLWAAVTIQRFYRSYRGLEFRSLNVSSSELPYLSLSSPRLDYETYIKYRKTHERGTLSDAALSHPAVSAENSYEGDAVFQNRLANALQGEEGKSKVKVRLNINLNLLAATTARIVDESERISSKSNSLLRSAKQLETKQPSTNIRLGGMDLKSLSKSSGLDFVPFDRSEEKRDKRFSGKYFTQYQFLGPVSKSDDQSKKAIVENGLSVPDDLQGKIPFRLSVTKPPRMRPDFLEEMTTKTIEIVRDIRESMRDFERRRAARPKAVVEKRYPVTTDQKLFIRTHGTMALTSFRAVDQAYKDRDRAESLSSKAMRVREMKQVRESTSEMLKRTKNAALEKMAIKNADAKRELTELLEDNKTQYVERQKTSVSKGATSRNAHKDSRNGRKLILDFMCQNNAVTKALAKHVINSSKEKRVSEKSVKLNTIKDDVFRQKEVIKKFYEHRNLVLQSETTITRTKIADQLTQQTQKREKDAQSRVNRLKKQKFCKPVPLIAIATAPPRLPPLAIVSENQLDVWEKVPKKERKQRIHDRVSIWT